MCRCTAGLFWTLRKTSDCILLPNQYWKLPPMQLVSSCVMVLYTILWHFWNSFSSSRICSHYLGWAILWAWVVCENQNWFCVGWFHGLLSNIFCVGLWWVERQEETHVDWIHSSRHHTEFVHPHHAWMDLLKHAFISKTSWSYINKNIFVDILFFRYFWLLFIS